MPNPKNSLLALDPGTSEMGFAYFEGRILIDYGVKSLRGARSVKDMLIRVECAVRRLVREKKPKIIVMEKNNFSQITQNARLMLAVYKIKSIATANKIRSVEYNPRTIRKAVCNNGNATKREVARTITACYPELKPYVESNRRWRERYYQNIFDAIACALAFLKTTSQAR
jgi:Holliday junction resolvasome RuvABC endonuclease subunit